MMLGIFVTMMIFNANSQIPLKNIGTDTLQIRIAAKHLMAGTMALKEVKGLRLTVFNQQKELYIANAVNKNLQESANKYQKAAEIKTQVADSLIKVVNNQDIINLQLKQDNKQKKNSVLVASTVSPVVGVLLGALTYGILKIFNH